MEDAGGDVERSAMTRTRALVLVIASEYLNGKFVQPATRDTVPKAISLSWFDTQFGCFSFPTDYHDLFFLLNLQDVIRMTRPILALSSSPIVGTLIDWS